MADVSLKLVADNKDAVKGIRETQIAAQKLSDTANSINKEMTALFQANKKGFSDISKLEAYVKQMESLKIKLQEVRDAEKKLIEEQKDLSASSKNMGDQSESLVKSFGKWIVQLGIVTTILNKLKEAFLDTRQGMILFNQAGAAMNQVLYNIVNGVGQWNQGVGEAIILARKMTELLIKDSREKLQSNKLMRDYNRLFTEANEIAGSGVERIGKLTEAKQKFIAALKIEINSTKEQLELAVQQWELAPTSEKARLKVMSLANEMSNLIERQDQGIRRMTRTIAIAEAALFTDVTDAIKQNLEAISKWEDDYYKEQKDKRDKALKEFNDDIKRNHADIKKWIETTWDSMVIQEKANKELPGKIFSLLGLDKSNLGLQKNIKFDAAWKAEKDAIKVAQEAFQEDIDLRNEKIDAVRDGLQELYYFTQSLTDMELEDAERRRSILEDHISEVERELEIEADLYAAGYASNVDAKKKELAALKTQRAKALKDEEEALKKQRAMESIAQGVNIFTSATNILKTFTELGPLGLVLAAGAITAMFGMIAIVKAKTNKVAGYAKGGWTGKGFYRDETGEKVAGVVHEEEFVVRHGPAHKFREVLEAANKNDRKAMLYAFNKLSPELLGGTTINNVVVENEGPNKRLDKLIQLNKKQNKEEVILLGDKIIYRKGNITRTVR